METEKIEYLNEKIQKSEELNDLQSVKESATSLEYNLQPSSNTEGEIKNNDARGSKIPEKLLQTIMEAKAEYWENLKTNPPQGESYDSSRDCVDTDAGATDSYGDACAAYTDYPSWCGGYDDDDFDSMAMCCACGGGEDDGSGGTDEC